MCSATRLRGERAGLVDHAVNHVERALRARGAPAPTSNATAHFYDAAVLDHFDGSIVAALKLLSRDGQSVSAALLADRLRAKLGVDVKEVRVTRERTFAGFEARHDDAVTRRRA